MSYAADQARAAADLIVHARTTHEPLDRLPLSCRPLDESDGYLVQELVHERLIAGGHDSFVGHKIGCTTAVMQEYLGIGNPCAGGVRSTTVRLLEGSFDQSEMLRVGVECELAVVLGEDIETIGETLTAERLSGAIASIAVAIEVVEDRYIDYHSLDTPTLIADDFFGAGCVLGLPVTDWRELDLASVEATMTLNGAEVGSGTGDAILGHPLEALRWLADVRQARGLPLREGELVLLGSLVQTHWVGAGDVIAVQSPQLGVATARIA